MKAQYVYEKFTKDSDPIKDMGIGATTWENLKVGDVLRIKKPIYSCNHKVGNYIFIEDMQELDREKGHHGISFKYKEYLTKESLIEKTRSSGGNRWEMSISWAKKYFDIVQKWELKESMCEKFEEDTDPIQDMGIGLLNRNFTFKSQFVNFLIPILPFILKTSKIPEDILIGGGAINQNYYKQIRQFLDDYNIKFDNIPINIIASKVYLWPNDLRYELLRKGFNAYKDRIDLDSPETHLHEKFTDVMKRTDTNVKKETKK